MLTTQFIVYNITVLLVIAHFFDSAKEKEWTDKLYMGSYPLWLVTSLLLVALALGGIVPVYLGNTWGDILSWIVAFGGLGAAGYHIPMNRSGRSDVCNNHMSYVIMALLGMACVALGVATMMKL